MVKQSSYIRTRERLEEIVTSIRSKDVPLEKSLDLYEEALRLGSACAEMIDHTDFSTEELENATNYQGLDSMEELEESQDPPPDDQSDADQSAVDQSDADQSDAQQFEESQDPLLENDDFSDEEIVDEDYLFEGFDGNEESY